MVRPLLGSRSYRNHVRMHQGPGKTMVDDVYVFDGDDMVALTGGVKFQAITRSLLNKLLPQNGNRIITEFMSIVSEELGLESSKLQDGALFVDIGLDSLISLTVTGRLREEYEIDVPTSFFVDKPTIEEAKFAILAQDSGNPEKGALTESASAESASIDSAAVTDAMSDNQITRNTSIETDMAKYPAEEITEKLLSTVSEEIGVERSQLLETSNFVDMSVDSLMSLSITERIREELDLNLPTTFFVDHPSVGEASIAISALTETSISGNPTPSSHSKDSSTDETNTLPTIHNSNDQIWRI